MSLFTRQLSQTSKRDAPIAIQSDLAHIRSMRVLFLCLIVWLLVMAGLFMLVDSIASRSISVPWQLLNLPLIWLCWIGFSFYLERRWKPLEAKRLTAVRGDERLLAREQPQANAEALMVPVTIASRSSRRILLVYGPLITLLMIVVGNAAFLIQELRQQISPDSLWPWLLAMTIAILAIMLLVFIVLWRQRTAVVVNRDGIQMRPPGMGMGSLLFWADARLFACYRQPFPWSKGWVITYELASANHVVQWKWVQKNDPLRIIQQPVLPYEEHQAQMRALCSLVAAKTGLALYDLNAEQLIGGEDRTMSR